MLISPEDVLTVSSNALASGPSITGSIEPERRADLRAEVSAVVLAVLKENGDPVKRGDLLVRLDQTSIRDSLTAAEASARAADAGIRTGRTPVPAHGHAAADRRGFHAAARRRGDPPQFRAERSRRRAHPRGHRAPATRAHRSARAVRRHRQRPQGVGGRHRRRSARNCSRSSIRPACDSKAWCRLTASAKCRPASTCGSGSMASPTNEFTGMITRVNPAANITTRQVEVLVAFDDAKQAAERRRPVCRGSRRNSQQRDVESSRRIHRARGRQRICVAREGAKLAEGRADARRSRSRAPARSRCEAGSPRATRCCDFRTPR